LVGNKKSTEFIEFGGFSQVKGLKRRKEIFSSDQLLLYTNNIKGGLKID
jgi:hypothetical protein